MTDFSDLIAGYRRFREHDYDRHPERWAKLAEGQSPRVLVIACADSRTDPAMVFDAAPGEIFVVRDIAALVPPFDQCDHSQGVAAAIEYAVTQLEVPEIVVLGHGQCGGVHAALTQAFADAAPGEGGFLGDWVSLLNGARDRVVAEQNDGPDARRALELEAVRVSIANLRTFPAVAERERAGRLRLIGAHFAIRDGIVRVMGSDGTFAPA